jgi:hypothetical protein
MQTKTYNVVSGLNHAGKHHKAGTTINLTDRQAQYFLLAKQIALPKTGSSGAAKPARIAAPVATTVTDPAKKAK